MTQTARAGALRANDFVSQSSITDANQQLRNSPTQNQANTCGSPTVQNSGSNISSPQDRVAQAARNCPRPTRIAPLTVPEIDDAEFESSPGLSIYIPVGFGADRIGIVDNGKLIELGTLQDLRQKHGEGLVMKQEGERWEYKFFPTLEEANAYLDLQPDKTAMMIRPSNLEDIFVDLTGRGLN